MSQPLNPGDLHEDHIVELLRTGAHAALLSHYFGEAEYRELSALARLAAARRRSRRRAPLVLILPGVMGSRLARVHRRAAHVLWLHPHAIGEGALMQLALPGARAIRPVGVMLPGYLKLKLWLEAARLRAAFHPFDWRADVENSARVLMQRVEQVDGPVSLVAHSMGGLVARAALRLDRRGTIRRIVQLGAPNSGSFAPLQAMRAVYPTVRKLACLDEARSAEELAAAVFRTFHGLYQMLPNAQSPDELDLFDADQWPHDALRPDEKRLARARRVRARLPDADDRCGVIIGVKQETIDAVRAGADGFEYEVRVCGDGTVPATRAHWPGATHWYVEENHGALTLNRTVLGAVIDLLKRGDTSQLSSSAPPAAVAIVRRTSDAELRARARHKVQWDTLTPDSKRRILEPLLTSEFLRNL